MRRTSRHEPGILHAARMLSQYSTSIEKIDVSIMYLDDIQFGALGSGDNASEETDGKKTTWEGLDSEGARTSMLVNHIIAKTRMSWLGYDSETLGLAGST